MREVKHARSREGQEAHIVVCEGQDQLDAKGLCLVHYIVQTLPAITYYVTKYCWQSFGGPQNIENIKKFTNSEGKSTHTWL